jgi:hypothetical protein
MLGLVGIEALLISRWANLIIIDILNGFEWFIDLVRVWARSGRRPQP